MNPARASPSTPVGAPHRAKEASLASPPSSPPSAVVSVPSPPPSSPQAAITSASTASKANSLLSRFILSPPLDGAAWRTTPPARPTTSDCVVCARILGVGRGSSPPFRRAGEGDFRYQLRAFSARFWASATRHKGEVEMARITMEGLGKVYEDGTRAVGNLDLEIHDGEFLVLVGPSGCGKSTVLRMIAGLEDITEGTMSIGDRVVNDVAPKDRDIAMVFQNYALYPHMSVYDNMAFGLKQRKFSKDEIQRRVNEAADILEISEYLQRKTKTL